MLSETISKPKAPTIFTRCPFYYGWVNVLIAAIAMVLTMAGTEQGRGLITESLLKDLQIDRIHWSNINLWATLISALFVYQSGKWIDRFGSRVVLTASLVPLGLTVIGMSRATNTTHLWITAIFAGILAQSPLSLVSMALPGKWFSRRVTMAMAVYSILMTLGFMFAFSVFGRAIVKHGWRGPWEAFGYVILLAAFVSWLLVRATPESVGLEGDYKSESKNEISGITCNAALKTPAFWLFGLSSAFFTMLINGIFLFYESILHERGFDSHARDLVLEIQMFTGLLFSFIGGWAGMRWSMGKLMAIAMAVLAGSLIWLTKVSSFAGVVVYAISMGIAGALITVIFFAVWERSFGQEHLAVIMGVAQGLCIVAGAFGGRILAQVQAATGSYAPAFLACAVVSDLRQSRRLESGEPLEAA